MLIGAQLRQLARDEAGALPGDDTGWTLKRHENAIRGAIGAYGTDLLDVLDAAGTGQGVLVVGQAMYEASPIRSIKDYLDIAQQGPRAEEDLNRQLRYQVGLPPVLSQTQRAIDPYFREVDSILESTGSRLPGVSETLEPQLDVFGAPRQRPTAGPRSLIPGSVSRDLKASDPLRAELDRVGYVLSDRKKPGGETEDQHRLRKRIEGPKLRQNLESLIRSEAYQLLPDRYEQALRRQIPDLPDEAYRAEAEKLARRKQNDMLGDEAERIRRWYTDQVKAIKAVQQGPARTREQNKFDPETLNRLLIEQSMGVPPTP